MWVSTFGGVTLHGANGSTSRCELGKLCLIWTVTWTPAHRGKSGMNPTESIVFLLDDNESMVRALTRLLTSDGLVVRGFTSPYRFFESYRQSARACLVL